MFTPTAPRILALYTLTTATGHSQDLLDALKAITGSTVVLAGCISSRIFQNPENPSTFLLYEEWTDAGSLEQHFTTPVFYRFMLALELCIFRPDVVFISDNRIKGMEWVEEVLSVGFGKAETDVREANNNTDHSTNN